MRKDIYKAIMITIFLSLFAYILLVTAKEEASTESIAERWDGRFVSDHNAVLAEIMLTSRPKM
jgi:hypothetical protein